MPVKTDIKNRRCRRATSPHRLSIESLRRFLCIRRILERPGNSNTEINTFNVLSMFSIPGLCSEKINGDFMATKMKKFSKEFIGSLDIKNLPSGELHRYREEQVAKFCLRPWIKIQSSIGTWLWHFVVNLYH